MWDVAPTTQFLRDQEWYKKKHPSEFAAVFHNLGRYLEQLNVAKNHRSVTAGYLHHEPSDVVAVDQKGAAGKLQQTRLYTFADPDSKTLHLITIGDKRTQRDDIKLSTGFVKSLFP